MGIRTLRVSPQQRDIVNELACDGAGNAEIAERLETSVDVVQTQIRRVRMLAGCDNRTELAVKVARGLIRLG